MSDDILKRARSHKQGDGVLIWGMFSGFGELRIHVAGQHFNAKNYVEVLKRKVTPVVRNADYDITYQHDNASIHTATITRDYLANNNIFTLQWPTMSPDLNTIENL